MRYRKRPVVVEARGPLTEPEFVTTAHGRVRAEAGDYVLLAESGDTWPIKPDIFAATYERVEDEPAWNLQKEVEQMRARGVSVTTGREMAVVAAAKVETAAERDFANSIPGAPIELGRAARRMTDARDARAAAVDRLLEAEETNG